MKLKRIVSAVLAFVMLGSTATVIASAEETTTKTYNYVALGDSIAAGYGLEGLGATDKALILSENLIADPVKTAYAQVFGGYLEELGEEYGYTTSAVNLSSTAYRAEDVAKVITTPGYKGEVAESILENFVGPGTSQYLIPYHDIYNKYLPDADLISIQLGANDMIMAVVYPMMKTDNPIMRATATSAALVLFGYDVTTALGAGYKYLASVKDDLKVEHIAEVTKYFANVLKNKDQLSTNAANNVKSVVDAVRTVNTEGEIALVNMFNPFGNSLEYDGQVRDLCTVMTNIYIKAIDEAIDVDIEVGDITITPSTDVNETVEELNDIAVEIKDIEVDPSYFTEMRKERAKALLTIAAGELSYPLQYLLLGKNTDPQIKKLNQLLKDYAEEEGLGYVDVYDISNENNLDPHPTKEGHKEIADRLYATLSGDIKEIMKGSEQEPETDDKWLIGDVNMDGTITISDVTLIQKSISGLAELTDLQNRLADVNGDNTVTVADATALQKYLSYFTDGIGNAGKPLEDEPTEPTDPTEPTGMPEWKTFGDVMAYNADTNYYYSNDTGICTAIEKYGDKYVKATATLSKEAKQKVDALDDSDPQQYYAQLETILATSPITELTDVTDKLVSQEDLDKFVGKTGQDLLDAGFVFTDFGNDDGKLTSFNVVKDYFEYEVTVDGDVTIGSEDDMDQVLAAAKIGEITLYRTSTFLIN